MNREERRQFARESKRRERAQADARRRLPRLVSAKRWAELGDGAPVEDGAKTFLGIDVEPVRDCAVVAWASPASDGRVDVGCHVMATREDAAHHELHPEDEVDPDRFEMALAAVVDRLRVVEVAYDGRRSSDVPIDLLRKLLPCAKIAAVDFHRLREVAIAALEDGISAGAVRHDGDPVLAEHLRLARVERWNSRAMLVREDATVGSIGAAWAVAMAYWRASLPHVDVLAKIIAAAL